MEEVKTYEEQTMVTIPLKEYKELVIAATALETKLENEKLTEKSSKYFMENFDLKERINALNAEIKELKNALNEDF